MKSKKNFRLSKLLILALVSISATSFFGGKKTFAMNNGSTKALTEDKIKIDIINNRSIFEKIKNHAINQIKKVCTSSEKEIINLLETIKGFYNKFKNSETIENAYNLIDTMSNLLSKCKTNLFTDEYGGSYALEDPMGIFPFNFFEGILKSRDTNKMNDSSVLTSTLLAIKLNNFRLYGTMYPKNKEKKLPLNEQPNIFVLPAIKPDNTIYIPEEWNQYVKDLPYILNEIEPVPPKGKNENKNLEGKVYDTHPGASSYHYMMYWLLKTLQDEDVGSVSDICEIINKALEKLSNNSETTDSKLDPKIIDDAIKLTNTNKDQNSDSQTLSPFSLFKVLDIKRISFQTDDSCGRKHDGLTAMIHEGDEESLKLLQENVNKVVQYMYPGIYDNENIPRDFIVIDDPRYGRRVPQTYIAKYLKSMPKNAKIPTILWWMACTDNLDVQYSVFDKDWLNRNIDMLAVAITEFYHLNPDCAYVAIKPIVVDNKLSFIFSADLTGKNLEHLSEGTIIFSRADMPSKEFKYKGKIQQNSDNKYVLSNDSITLDENLDWKKQINNEYYLKVFVKTKDNEDRQFPSTITSFKVKPKETEIIDRGLKTKKVDEPLTVTVEPNSVYQKTLQEKIKKQNQQDQKEHLKELINKKEVELKDKKAEEYLLKKEEDKLNNMKKIETSPKSNILEQKSEQIKQVKHDIKNTAKQIEQSDDNTNKFDEKTTETTEPIETTETTEPIETTETTEPIETTETKEQ